MRLSALQVRSVVAADFQVTCAPTQNTQNTLSRFRAWPGRIRNRAIFAGPAEAVAEDEKNRTRTRRIKTGDAENRQGPRQINRQPGD